MAGIRDIKRQIKSIGNTKKITKAMEMVSAAKMRKAVDAVLRTRTYANLSWETVLNLSKANEKQGGGLHPMLTKRAETKRIAVILIAGNRGLCGGFNSAVVAKAASTAKKFDLPTDFIILGKKARSIYKNYNFDITNEFVKQDIASSMTEIIPAAKLVIGDYLAGKYDKVMVAYTDFVSASKQQPKVKQLLPVELNAEDNALGVVGEDTRIGVSEKFVEGKTDKHLHDESFSYEYKFEPSPKEVLDEMVPRLVEVQLYQALLESNASEHSASMNAMHQATEAAGDMITELTLYYNKARQEKITAEIAEISAGANALKDK